MIGRDPKWVAAQIGHVNPKFTFSVYQQVATRRYIDEQAVWALMRFADRADRTGAQPAGHPPRSATIRVGPPALAGRVRPGARPSQRRRGRPVAGRQGRVINAVINAASKIWLIGAAEKLGGKKNPAIAGLFEAAEGARTLDLLHGKQTL